MSSPRKVRTPRSVAFALPTTSPAAPERARRTRLSERLARGRTQSAQVPGLSFLGNFGVPGAADVATPRPLSARSSTRSRMALRSWSAPAAGSALTAYPDFAKKRLPHSRALRHGSASRVAAWRRAGSPAGKLGGSPTSEKVSIGIVATPAAQRGSRESLSTPHPRHLELRADPSRVPAGVTSPRELAWSSRLSFDMSDRARENEASADPRRVAPGTRVSGRRPATRARRFARVARPARRGARSRKIAGPRPPSWRDSGLPKTSREDAEDSLDELAALTRLPGAGAGARCRVEREWTGARSSQGQGGGAEGGRGASRRESRRRRPRSVARASAQPRGDPRVQGARPHGADPRHLRAPRPHPGGEAPVEVHSWSICCRV